MSEDFLHQVGSAFSFLTKGGYVVSDRLVATSFDNALVDFSGHEMKVRVIRERSQVFIDFAAMVDPETWFDLDIVLRLLDADTESRRVVGSGEASVEALAAVLQQYLSSIEIAFETKNYPTTKQKLAALQEKRADERFGPL